MLKNPEFETIELFSKKKRNQSLLGIPAELIVTEAATRAQPIEYESGHPYGWLSGLQRTFAVALHAEKKNLLLKPGKEHLYDRSTYLLHLVSNYYKFSLLENPGVLFKSSLTTAQLAEWIKPQYYRDERAMAFAVLRQTQNYNVTNNTPYSLQFADPELFQDTPLTDHPKSTLVDEQDFPDVNSFDETHSRQIDWTYKHNELPSRATLAALAWRIVQNPNELSAALEGFIRSGAHSEFRPEHFIITKVLPTLGSKDMKPVIKDAGSKYGKVAQDTAQLLVDFCLAEIAGEGIRVSKRNFIFTPPFPLSQTRQPQPSTEREESPYATYGEAKMIKEPTITYTPEFVIACLREIPYFITSLAELVVNGVTVFSQVRDWADEYIRLVAEPLFNSLPTDHPLRKKFVDAVAAVLEVSYNPRDYHKTDKKREKVSPDGAPRFTERVTYFREKRSQSS